MADNYTKPEVWWIEGSIAAETGNHIGIATQSGTAFSGPAGSVDIKLYTIEKPNAFTADLTVNLASPDSNEPLLEEFHDAIVSKAIQRGYELKDPQMAMYWEGKFQNAIIDGKKYANKGADGSSYTIQGYDY